LYVGTLSQRRIHETVEGLSIFIKKTGSHIIASYDIFGYGTTKDVEKLIYSIHNYGLDNIVSYHGMKNHTELKAYFEKCNLGVSYVPITEYYDLQPVTKTYEYILSGLPCIGTETYANRKVINDQNGVLCKDNAESFASALDTIVQRRGGLDSSKIRATLRDFSWQSIVEFYLKPLLDK